MTQMMDIQQILHLTTKECFSHHNWLIENYPLVWDGFAVLDKNLVLTNEILGLFQKSWLPVEVGLFAGQYRERIKIVLRSALILGLSIVEYSLKRNISEMKNGNLFSWYSSIKETGKFVNFRMIIEKSKKLNIITENQERNWLGINKLRNMLVHNNGYASENEEISIHGLKFITVVDEPVQIKWEYYIQLLRIQVALYRKWIESYIQN